jgi:phosphoglycolate phosphatase
MAEFRYRLIIFDCDGTLADTLPGMQHIYNEVAGGMGLPLVEDAQLDTLRTLHGDALLRALQVPLWKLPVLVAKMRRAMGACRRQWLLFDGIPTALNALFRKGFHLAIVSSNSRQNVIGVLGAELASLIRDFDCSASIFGKASRLKRLLRRTGISASHTIYVGDEVRDSEAAKECGITFAAVTWGYHGEELLRAQDPSVLLRTPSDMISKLAF